MNCRLCSQNFKFQNPKKHPRVLIQCGHTFCDECIQLNLNHNQEIFCKECGKCSVKNDRSSFPLNETLMGILKKNQEGLCEFIKEFQVCKSHGKKLEAYCESDDKILCLNCILGDHKSHKVLSIGQKVQKQKQILKVCEQEILKSQETLKSIEKQCVCVIDRYELDLNQYLFEINLLSKNIYFQLKEIEEKFISQTKRNIEKSIKTIKETHQFVQQKTQFYNQLKNMHTQIFRKTGVEFLNENNKRLFLIQNSSLKDKFVMPYHKYNLQKQKFLNQVIESLQQLVSFQNKKSSMSNQNKINTSKVQSSNTFIRSVEKNLKNNSKDQSYTKNSQESPNKIQKKNANSIQKANKQPQILEVNLVQKYQKHQQNKNIKKKSSQLQLSAKAKSPKIQYEIRRQVELFQKIPTKKLNQINKLNQSTQNRIGQQKALYLNRNLSNWEKISKNSGILQKDDKRSMIDSKIYSNDFQMLRMSIFDQTINTSSPDKIVNPNQTFEIETPLSINSFMDSSRFTVNNDTVNNDKKENTILKNSRDQFSLFCCQQKVYHFGGLKNDSISSQTITTNFDSNLTLSVQKINQGFYRSKAQCVILKNYHPKKCLILGGKDQNGERSKSIFQYDIQKNQLKKSHLELHEPTSGFGAVVNQNKLYIFGGSSALASKTLYQYQLGKNGFEIKKLNSMTNSRDQLGFALGLDGNLYVAGGINSSNSILNSCEKYSFKTKKWSSMPAMKIPRRSFSLVNLPHGLFAIGGHDGKSFRNSVEMFNFELDSWVQVAGLNEGRFTHSSVSTNDYQHIIVFGGFQSEPLKSVQIYNSLQNKWKIQNQMDSERYLHCSLMIQQ